MVRYITEPLAKKSPKKAAKKSPKKPAKKSPKKPAKKAAKRSISSVVGFLLLNLFCGSLGEMIDADSIPVSLETLNYIVLVKNSF